MNEQIKKEELLNREPETKVSKRKLAKKRTAKALISLFALTSLCSCSNFAPFHGVSEFYWIKALFNADTEDGEDDADPAQGIGARFSYNKNNGALGFEDVFETNVKSMDAHSYICDYYKLCEIVDTTPKNRTDQTEEVLYTDLGLTDDDIMYYTDPKTGTKTFQITESGGEKLKNNPEIVNLWYYNSNDKYQLPYYLPCFLKVKNEWKDFIRPELHNWFKNKIEKEQENILKTNNTNWALSNSYSGYNIDGENVKCVDLASAKGYIPYKLGINFLNKIKGSNSFCSYAKNAGGVTSKRWNRCSGECDYIYYGSKNAYGNSSLSFNNLVLESKYVEFPASNLLSDTMEYDDYRDIMLTAKESLAINSISYDLEVYNVANTVEVENLENSSPSTLGMEVGEFRLEQLGTYREYVKRIDGAFVGQWLATQNAVEVGTKVFENNYIFENEGQTKLWGYCTKEEQSNYYFKEGETYHIEIGGIPDLGSTFTQKECEEFRLVIPQGCNLNLKIELKGKNKYSFYKIKNLKIDYDVVDSWTYIEKYTLPGFSANVNCINEHY